jgi:hypothetical protein
VSVCSTPGCRTYQTGCKDKLLLRIKKIRNDFLAPFLMQFACFPDKFRIFACNCPTGGYS